MSDSTFIDSVFSDIIEPAATSRFAKYGLGRNPFPGNEDEFYGFIIGQNEAKIDFKSRTEQFLTSRRVTAVLVEADHRVGKTNFLKHYHNRLRELYDISLKRDDADKYLPIYTNVYEYDFFFLYQHIVECIPDEVFQRVGRSMSENPLTHSAAETDLVRALRSLGAVYATLGDSDKERRSQLLKRWLRGGYRSLNKEEREEVGVQDNVTNSPVGSRFLRDLIEILNARKILSGILLFLDEFERLVGAGISRGQKDRYLNDIRNFISDFQHGAFFCFAITPGALQELQRLYPAIPPWLGTKLPLKEIASEIEAVEFANAYVAWFRAQSGTGQGAIQQAYPPILSGDQIANTYLRLQQRFTRHVPQGHFLAALRDDADKASSR